MAYLYTSWHTWSIYSGSGTVPGYLYTRLRLDYTVSSTNTGYTVAITGCGVEAYTDASTSYSVTTILVKSSDTFAKKNYYYNSTAHTNTYKRSADIALTISRSSSSPGYTALDNGTNYSYDISRTTSDLATTLQLWGSIKLAGTANGTYAYGSESSPAATVAITISKLPSYTVSYNANSGSGAPASQTKWYGANLTLSSTVPTRTGYTFKGWATSSGGSVAYQPGGTYSANAAVILYAVWQINTWTVTLNANGGTNGSVTSFTKTYGVSASFPTSAQSPTRSGYTFLGWGTSATSTSVTYAASATYSANSGGTFYAIWRKQLTLSYNANDGSGAPSSSSQYVYNAATSYTFTVSSTAPTKSGYTFLGWSTSSTATSASYSANSTITISSNTTLYAIWRKQLTLSYNANSGSGAPASQSGYVYNSTTSYTFTLSSTVPTRANWTFLGWGTSSTATTASYQPGGTVSISANTTIYAVWQAAYNKATISNKEVIRSNSNGDSDDEGAYAKIKFSWSGTKLGDTTCTPSSITIYSRQRGVTPTPSWTSVYSTSSISGTSGTVEQIVGGSYSTSYEYDFRIVIDNHGTASEIYDVLSTAYFTIDVNPDGSAIGFFGSAPDNEEGFFLYKDMKLVIDTSAASGTLDGDLYAALTALGWQSLA